LKKTYSRIIRNFGIKGKLMGIGVSAKYSRRVK